MNLTEIIKQDYQNFPEDQTYSIYAENVHFKDPVYNFYGLKKYQEMINFLKKWFKNLHLELHEIKQTENQIDTRWTMSWNSPLPWQPFISVSGRSELKLKDNLIIGHYDYWDKSFWNMIQQHFVFIRNQQVKF
ncbi:hypothetical protein GM3708_1449 [Geminocystis sp. NIES-3708]|uniref:DUF2358 domain-containing protein n=1 Tax=Geminocystis sp. NIES-3708 TaxID=1615909 RepID=UPI0005FC7D3B|nr:DUF2358 domain-containing protein [Geminocystis sp. NIES-3708]BAQ61043.1 hypothetical protein GM3708_1449 [Geminocystis sp. NIES-3708]